MAKAKQGGAGRKRIKRRRGRSKEFRWTVARETAARLLAEDVLNMNEIAAQIGVTRKAIDFWKTYPAFNKRVEEIAKKLVARALRYDIAKQDERVRHLDRYLKKLDRVVEQRAADPEMKQMPGG